MRGANPEPHRQNPSAGRAHRHDRRLTLRREHLAQLRPTCPGCRSGAQLALGTVLREDDEDIRQGVLLCPNEQCRREHPIIDGIPVVVADLPSWATHQFDAVMRRDDLSPFTESLLGDAAGPMHAFDRERQTISAYGQVHWAEDSLTQLLRVALGLLAADPKGVWIDLGCAVGRASFEMARRTQALCVGVDLSFGMLRVAERARREHRAVFDVRRVGVVYERCEIPLADVSSDNVSFWCCDVGNLPFSDRVFEGALSLNVLDCVPSPLQHLMEIGRILESEGTALLSSPYDWSPSATPIQQWLGGHSQRGPRSGSSSAEVRRVLSAMPEIGLSIDAERDDVPWRVYVNERAAMDYRVHLMRLRRSQAQSRV